MIMPALIVIREAIRMLYTKIEARIVGVENREADQRSIYIEISKPLVDFIPRL